MPSLYQLEFHSYNAGASRASDHGSCLKSWISTALEGKELERVAAEGGALPVVNFGAELPDNSSGQPKM